MSAYTSTRINLLDRAIPIILLALFTAIIHATLPSPNETRQLEDSENDEKNSRFSENNEEHFQTMTFNIGITSDKHRGGLISLQVTKLMTVETIKALISGYLSIPIRRQKLKYCDTILQNHRRLEYYGVTSYEVFEVIIDETQQGESKEYDGEPVFDASDANRWHRRWVEHSVQRHNSSISADELLN